MAKCTRERACRKGFGGNHGFIKINYSFFWEKYSFKSL